MSLTAKIETPSITYDQPIGLYIDGKWVKGVEGRTFETINPTNEKTIIAVHEAGPEGEWEPVCGRHHLPFANSSCQMLTSPSRPPARHSMAFGLRLPPLPEAKC
jgi:hypothetical protein